MTRLELAWAAPSALYRFARWLGVTANVPYHELVDMVFVAALKGNRGRSKR